MDPKALTKVQSAALIAVVVVAAVSGGAAYMLWRTSQPPPEAIRIGICGDLDTTSGKAIYQGALLAVEQINDAGGLLGRNLTVVAEDDDSTSGGGIEVATNALTKLITVDKADFVISTGGVSALVQQDVCSEHKKILVTIGTTADEQTQRVLDNYEKYKYYFRVWMPNATTLDNGHIQGLESLKNMTGFTKIGYLLVDTAAIRKQTVPQFEDKLPRIGFEIVYRATYPTGTVDFASYFAAAEESGAEILFLIHLNPAVAPALVKEWHGRESPFVLWGDIYGLPDPNFWNLTEGKTEYVSFRSNPVTAGYPLTSKTMATREAYIERWGAVPRDYSISAYDAVRFILSDAIRRAGTIETEAVIKALEATNVETSIAGRFAFTSSHDVLIGEAGLGALGEAHMLYSVYQWQNGAQIPVFPEELRIAAGATYKCPPWPGPWSE